MNSEREHDTSYLLHKVHLRQNLLLEHHMSLIKRGNFSMLHTFGATEELKEKKSWLAEKELYK